MSRRMESKSGTPANFGEHDSLMLENIIQLQRIIGNQAVGRWIQAKMTVSEPDDAQEREADHAAESVLLQGEAGLQRQPQEEEEEELLQAKLNDSVPGLLRSATSAPLAIRHSALPQISRQGLLTPGQELAAIYYNTSRYDERSIRIIQIVSGTNVDGQFGRNSAEAVAAFQQAQGLAVDGKVGPSVLNAMVSNRVAANRREHAIQIVVDFYNLDVTTDTLAVRFDPGVFLGTTDFESGNLRVIRLGPLAFFSAEILRFVISQQLAVPPPAAAPLAPRPAILNRAQEIAAIRFNRGKFSDRRSVRAIQGHVGATPDGLWGADTVQRVAQAQQNAGIGVDGKVGEGTLENFTLQLIAANQQNAAFRMIVDYYNFRDDGNLLNVFFDPTVAANASTDFRPNEPVRVRVGPAGLAQPFTGIVHTIAHEYEHVRRLKQGIVAAATHEFLGEAIEILSRGMQEEPLESVAPGAAGYVAGFADDAGRALANWNIMPLADQRQFRARFIAVRRRVRTRIAAGTPAQQALHAGLLAGYNAVILPAP